MEMASGRGAATAGPVILRWALPAALLAVEYLTLSLLVDLPTSGPALRLVEAIRLAAPIAIGSAVGGWLLAGRSTLRLLHEGAATLPPWRPLPALALQPVVFAATAVLTHRLMRDDARPPGPGGLLVWCATVAACLLLALRSAAPLGWTASRAADRWRLPLLSLAVGLLAWWTAAAVEGTWGTLSGGTLRAVAWLLERVTGDVILDLPGRAVGARGFEVVIAPVCSGVNGVGLVLVFQAVWMFVSRARLRLPRALLLLPLGALAALLANALRIAALVLVGASGRDDLAMGGFHSKLGWILFVPIALGSIALAERVRWLRREDAGRPGEDALPGVAAAYVAPLVGALVAALATGLWSEGPLDPWYGLRVGAAALALWLVRRSLPAPSLSPSWVAVALAAAVAVPWIALGGDRGGVALAEALGRLPPSQRGAWILLRVAGSCLVLPVAEELAFRGFLLPALISPDFGHVPARAWTWPAVLLSSAAFGTVHGNWLLGTAAGCAFAAARLWRGRLSDAIAAHALCNAAIAATALLGGRWDLWT